MRRAATYLYRFFFSRGLCSRCLATEVRRQCLVCVLRDFSLRVHLEDSTQNTLYKKGVTFNEAMKQFYNFCKTKNNIKLPMFSYGNDYGVIKYNLKLNSINKKSRFYKWEKKFYDIRPIFDFYVDTSKYSSGTIYKAFDIDSKNANVHNALWDCKSIFYSLKHIIS